LFAFGTPNVTSAGYIERQCANQRLFRETVATGEERTRTKRATEIATDGKFGNLGDSQSVFYSFYHLMTGYLQDFPENKEKATPFIWRALVAIVMACKNPKVVIWAQRMASLWPWLAFAIVLEGQAILASAVEIASNSKVVGAMRSNKQVDATAYLNLVHRGLTLANNLVTMSTTGTSAFFSTEPICFVLFADRKRVMKKHIEAESTAETAKQYTPTKPKQDSGKQRHTPSRDGTTPKQYKKPKSNDETASDANVGWLTVLRGYKGVPPVEFRKDNKVVSLCMNYAIRGRKCAHRSNCYNHHADDTSRFTNGQLCKLIDWMRTDEQKGISWTTTEPTRPNSDNSQGTG